MRTLQVADKVTRDPSATSVVQGNRARPGEQIPAGTQKQAALWVTVGLPGHTGELMEKAERRSWAVSYREGDQEVG